MRVLITGAGMVGCHTASVLRQRGDDVRIVDVRPNPAYVARVAGPDVPADRVDVRDLPDLVAAVQRTRAEAVIHTAALIGGVAGESPWRGYTVNVTGTANVAQAAALGGARRLVHASTHGVYDRRRAPTDAPIPEDAPTGGRPRMYPATKVAVEALLPALTTASGLELVMLRFASAYGYGHFAGGSGIGIAISELIDAAARGVEATVPARLAEPDDLVYVKDVAEGVARAVHATDLNHEIYNIGSGVCSAPADLVAALQAVAPGFTAHVPDQSRGTASLAQPLDLTRARQDLGYEPAFGLVEGLRDCLEQRALMAEA